MGINLKFVIKRIYIWRNRQFFCVSKFLYRNLKYVGGDINTAKEFIMKKRKKITVGVLVMALVFGITVIGCGFTAPAYYNFGDVRDDNYALIRTSPISIEQWIRRSEDNIDKDIFGVEGGLFSINRYEGWREWQRPRTPFVSAFSGEGDAIVRVAPGTYTFTVRFRTSQEDLSQLMPIDLTYNIEAGKGYSFEFSGREVETLGLLTVRLAKLTLYENDLDENGKLNFGSASTIFSRKKVAEQTKRPL